MDEEILKTLESIEGLLKKSFAASGGKKELYSKKTAAQKQDKDSLKMMRAVATNAKQASDELLGLSSGMKDLSSELSDTTKNFKSLNTSITGLINTIANASIQPAQAPIPAAPTTPAPQQNGILRAISNIPGTLRAAISRAIPRASAAAPAATAPIQAAAPINAASNGLLNGLKSLGGSLTAMTVGVLSAGSAFSNIVTAVKMVTKDYFMLAQVGLGSVENLKTMSLAAIRSGMSLTEYTKMIKNNTAVVTRMSSLEQFDAVTSAANKQLAAIGVFGDEAKTLQASLANSSVVMGTSTSDLTKSISSQIDVFDELRKTTNMTANEFANLVENLSQNGQVQNELLGLSGQERQARQRELLQTVTIGQRMGMTAEASKQLADALLAQRAATVKTRIDQGGVLRQLAAFTGNGALGERAAQLSLKGRNRTSAEDQEFSQILGTFQQSTQQMYEKGTLGTQNVLDQLNSSLGQNGLEGLMKASGEGRLAQESGQAGANKDFGKHVGDFGQFVGQLLAWSRGLGESIGGPLIAAVGSGIAFLFKNDLFKAVKSVFSNVSGAVAGAASSVSSFVKAILNMPKAIMTYGADLVNIFKSNGALGILKTVFSDAAGAVKTGASFLVDGLGGLIKAFGPAAAIISALIEGFTGEISNALDPGGGVFARIGGMITAAITAVPNMIIDAIGFVFGDNFGVMVQNMFDRVVAGANAGVKYLLGGLTSALMSPFKAILPKDSGLVKTLEGWTDSLFSSADKNADTLMKLTDDHTKTLKSISAENTKSAQSTEKSAKDATVKATAAQSKFNDVQMGMMSAGAILGDAKALIGTPAPVTPVTPAPTAPAEVNTPEQNNTQAANTTTTTSSDQSVVVVTNAMSENTDTLNKVLVVLQNILVEIQNQGNELPSKTVSFTSSEALANQLLRRDVA